MAQIDNRYAHVGSAAQTRGEVVDAGLRAYMLRVYNYMGAGVALTGLVAYAIYTLAVTTDPALAAQADGRMMGLRNGLFLTPFGQLVFASPLKWVLMLAPLAMVFFMSFRVDKMSVGTAQISFWAFAALMGASMSTIFLVFTGVSITRVFFITAATFGALSLWGYTTKKDLSGWGTFLIMGVIGIVIASVVNIFLQSSALQFAISVIGVLAFAGLTAYDTQRIKDMYYEVAGDAAVMTKAAIMGALSLYLDFINMFQSLLYLFGNRE
ncbi:MAG: Bax inhibitor-1/YccA family protein [Hyphomicrobiaceae bacterium]